MPSKKQPEPEVQEGAPEWMMTFSDCMTLLLTFFVLLLSFSSFDENIFRKLTTSMAQALPSVGFSNKQKESFLDSFQIVYNQEIEKGSEKPTLEQGQEDGEKEETEFEDFRDRKVFIVDSEKMFWGRGASVSMAGRKILDITAEFLKQMPNRIVICEKSVKSAGKEDDSGLKRAWSIAEYMCKKHDMDYNRFTISQTGTIKNISDKTEGRRVVEIVLLERNLEN